MRLQTRIGRYLAILLILGGAGASLAFAIPWMRHWLKHDEPVKTATQPGGPRILATDTLSISEDLVHSLGIRTVKVSKPTRYRGLAPLPGALALDPNRMARVHARFPGEVVEVGAHQDWTALAPALAGLAWQDGLAALAGALAAPGRPLSYGDPVYPGQLLAVVWNKDLVEKKWELVDALSQKNLDERTVARQEKLAREGAFPFAQLEESRRRLAQSRSAVAKAELTLRAWRLAEQDLAEVYAEESRIQQEGVRDRSKAISWARVEVRAPLRGTILEKNVIVGDIIDTTTDLFKIADLHILKVHANLYEEDLPLLLKLAGPVRWNLQLKSDPAGGPLTGTVEKIGNLIDPNQHTVLLTGQVANPQGKLRPGQFITANIQLPPPDDEVEIPTAALLEDGEESIVLVQPHPEKLVYVLRRVTVVHRFKDVVTVLADLHSDQPVPGALGRREWVVSSGALELRNLMDVLQK